MTQRLACADIAVMAGQAVAGICACVVKRRTHSDYSVVAGVTTTHKRRADMIKGASAKGSRGMTNTAILNGQHVSAVLATRITGKASVTAGCRAIVYYASMIKDSVSKTISVMA